MSWGLQFANSWFLCCLQYTREIVIPDTPMYQPEFPPNRKISRVWIFWWSLINLSIFMIILNAVGLLFVPCHQWCDVPNVNAIWMGDHMVPTKCNNVKFLLEFSFCEIIVYWCFLKSQKLLKQLWGSFQKEATLTRELHTLLNVYLHRYPISRTSHAPFSTGQFVIMLRPLQPVVWLQPRWANFSELEDLLYFLKISYLVDEVSEIAFPFLQVAERIIAAVEEAKKGSPSLVYFISFLPEDVRKQAAESTERYKEGKSSQGIYLLVSFLIKYQGNGPSYITISFCYFSLKRLTWMDGYQHKPACCFSLSLG